MRFKAKLIVDRNESPTASLRRDLVFRIMTASPKLKLSVCASRMRTGDKGIWQKAKVGFNSRKPGSMLERPTDLLFEQVSPTQAADVARMLDVCAKIAEYFDGLEDPMSCSDQDHIERVVGFLDESGFSIDLIGYELQFSKDL